MVRFLAFIAAMTGSGAQALSCLAPDPVQTFHRAMEAPDTYVILRGTLAIAEILIPPEVGKDQEHAVPVWFHGMALTNDGFTRPFDGPMIVQVTCAGPWCGTVPADTDLIFFVQVVDGTYTIDAGPCGAGTFVPDPKTEALLTSCLRGDACVSAQGLD
jgi:hypothetical protein